MILIAGQLLLGDEGTNLFFETQAPSDLGAGNPSGCYVYKDYSDKLLVINTNTGMGPSTHERKSICRRGWKRYSLGKTNMPGTRYSFTKKNSYWF